MSTVDTLRKHAHQRVSFGAHGGKTLLPVELAVDGNRDGTISLSGSGGNDQTTEDKPYRFWLNDDQDTDTSGTTGDIVPITQRDSTSGNIVSKRDLEDWTRLWISFKGDATLIKNMVQNGDTVALEFEPLSSGTDPTPSIKICEAAESSGSTGYINDDGTAGQQIGGQYGDVIHSQDGVNFNIVGSSPFKLPSSFWDDVDDNTPKHLIFEGVEEGKGKLTLVFLDSHGNKIGEGGAVYMDIKNVKKMYQHKTLGGQEAWPSGTDFSQDPAETKQAIVFVHGWRMSPADTVSFSETMFKRLWWRGFKGRFVAVRWDTYYNSTDFGWVPYGGQAIDAYLAKYNDSEHNAWLTSKSLANYVNSAVPKGYTRNLVAHSMGNVVVGDALQQGMTIDNYALLQAAIPAACYDTSTSLPPASTTVTAGLLGNVHLWDVSTPDDDPDSTTQNLAYRGRLQNVRGNLINFYLPDDYATSYAWALNNVLAKPPVYPIAGTDVEDGYLVFLFGYDRGAASGHKLFKLTGSGGPYRYLTDRDEADSYACRTWAKAVGAEGNTAGAVGSSVNLKSTTYGSPRGFDTDHSAEFDRNIQQLVPFYRELLRQLNIPQNQ